MKLSYSAISTYQKCPLSYKFLYVDRVATKPSHHLSFGSSIHSALEFFYKVEEGSSPCSLQRLLEELDNVWLTEGYIDQDGNFDQALEKEYKEKGRAILTQFYNTNIATFARPLAIEERFALDLDKDLTLSGVIDRIDRLQDGGIEIIDYKTNGKLPPQSKIKTDLQLPIYHMAVEARYGEAPKQVSLYFLVPNQKMSARKTKTDIARAKDTIFKVAGGIRDQKFDPVRNPLCAWCDFIELCPLLRDDPVIMAKARVNGKASSKNGGGPVSPEIEEIVDEYFQLAENLAAARARMGELQSVIHKYCEENGIAAISGQRGQLARKAHKTTHYNIDKLRALLEPRGLWDKVLDVNGKLLKELLSEATTGTELRQLIETAKEVEEINYILYIKEEIAKD